MQEVFILARNRKFRSVIVRLCRPQYCTKYCFTFCELLFMCPLTNVTSCCVTVFSTRVYFPLVILDFINIYLLVSSSRQQMYISILWVYIHIFDVQCTFPNLSFWMEGRWVMNLVYIILFTITPKTLFIVLGLEICSRFFPRKQ